MIEIIPAIDLMDGKCVRLSQGDFSRTTLYGDPLDMAIRFEDHGLKRLHLVDLDGAREGHVVHHRVVEMIATRTRLVIDAGGGLRSDEDVRIMFESGAHLITGGSIAVGDRPLFLGWMERYGAERVILGADFKDGRIAVSGWEEKTRIDLIGFLSGYMDEGIRQVICTDIELDGMLEGPSMKVYSQIREIMPELLLIASGGIRDIADIENLDHAGVYGVIVGKAIYENRLPLGLLQDYILRNE